MEIVDWRVASGINLYLIEEINIHVDALMHKFVKTLKTKVFAMPMGLVACGTKTSKILAKAADIL